MSGRNESEWVADLNRNGWPECVGILKRRAAVVGKGIGVIETKYIFAGNLRVAMIKGADTYYFHKDYLKSSTVVTDYTGEEANVAQKTEYLPFGMDRSNS